MSQDVSPQTVAHIAQLANLPLSEQEESSFAQAFTDTLSEIEKLTTLDTKNVEPTHHVTGLTNVWREDVVLTERVLSQEQAIGQAPHTLRGYVVVDRVLVEE